MSSNTWTPEELSSSVNPSSGNCWRVVEAQHVVSTAKITDSREEQTIVERLIEETKPFIPTECRHLSYLLYTPFRYRPHLRGSRFRRAHSVEGVFYAAEEVETAVAEMAFYRLLFFAESPSTPWPSNPGEYTAFEAVFQTDHAIDLTKAPLNVAHEEWTNLTDYAACQELADAARGGGVDVIRYQSVRDRHRRANIALLRCRAFAQHKEVRRQTWRFHTDSGGLRAICEAPRQILAFKRDAFSADPRMAGYKWDR
jgi:hypothetical protein